MYVEWEMKTIYHSNVHKWIVPVPPVTHKPQASNSVWEFRLLDVGETIEAEDQILTTDGFFINALRSGLCGTIVDSNTRPIRRRDDGKGEYIIWRFADYAEIGDSYWFNDNWHTLHNKLDSLYHIVRHKRPSPYEKLG